MRLDALRTQWIEWGFSASAVELLVCSFTATTHKSYDSYWGKWRAWAETQQPPIDIVRPPAQAMANFSASLLDAPGSTKRIIIAGVKSTIAYLTDRQAVERALQRGIKKVRPDKAKHDTYYPLDALWTQMRKFPWSSLSLASKRQRLLVALSIDTLARSGDLAHLYEERVEFTTQPLTGCRGMFVSFALPKTGGLFSTRLWVQAHTAEPEICSVWTMVQWLKDTQQLRWPSVVLPVRGVDHAYTPVFFNLQKKKMGETLSAEAVSSIRTAFLKSAGIDTTIFTAHSIRGAAVTAAILAGDGSDAWKENLRALGRWEGLKTMMRHYCVPAGVLPHRIRPDELPSSVSAAMRKTFQIRREVQ